MKASGTRPGERVPGILEKARSLIFDFDGTLVDSNPIKRLAFDACFEDFPERLEEIRAYCYGHNHTPRWEKFKYVYEKILGLPYTADLQRRLVEHYESLTTKQIIEAPEVPGAGLFLAASRKSHQTAVLSSAPNEILLEILSLIHI